MAWGTGLWGQGRWGADSPTDPDSGGPTKGGTWGLGTWGSPTTGWGGAGGPDPTKPGDRYLFTPPLRIMTPRLLAGPPKPSDSLWRRVPSVPAGINVWIKDGKVYEGVGDIETFAQADRVFLGGRTHEVSEQEAQLLIEAGYSLDS